MLRTVLRPKLLVLLVVIASSLSSINKTWGFYGDRLEYMPIPNPPESTRNTVLIYTAKDQPYAEFEKVWRNFTIQFLGLGGFSEELPLWSYYQGQVIWQEDTGQSTIQLPPYAVPYSGKHNPSFNNPDRGRIDVHNIPIPEEIGPVGGVVINTHSVHSWNIEKVVANGRTFKFDDIGKREMSARFSTHFIVGEKQGDWNLPEAAEIRAAIGTNIDRYQTTQHIKFPNYMYESSGKKYDPEKPYRIPTSPEHRNNIKVRFDVIALSFLLINENTTERVRGVIPYVHA